MKQANRIKQAMREGRLAYGYHLEFPAPWVIEILATQPFDFVWIDGEHGPFGLEQIEHICRTAESVGITPIARVPDLNASTILRYLDRGITGILGPHIASRDDVERLVKACYFGPLGERSFGGNRGTDYNHGISDKAAYYCEANENMLVGALLEDASVIDNLDAILAVPGVDYFGIGMNDFAQSLGFPGEPEHPEVQRASAGISERIRSAGRKMGQDIMASVWVRELLTGSAERFLRQ